MDPNLEMLVRMDTRTDMNLMFSIWGICPVGDLAIFIKCSTTTFLHTHSWLNWVDEDDRPAGDKKVHNTRFLVMTI